MAKNWVARKILPLAGFAEKQISTLGLPILDVKKHIQDYSEIEAEKVIADFETLANPIIELYRMVFEHLPSHANNQVQQRILGEIGAEYGALTLLVDAVEDAEDDKRYGRFNIAFASSDLLGDKSKCFALVRSRFEKLITLTSKISATAEAYIKAASDSTMARAFAVKKQESRFYMHPLSLGMLACIQKETDCSGTEHYSFDNGCCLIIGIGVAACCCCGCKD